MQLAAEEIIGHMRTDSKSIEELLKIICPVPEQIALHRMFIQEMLDEGIIKISSYGKIMMIANGNEETPTISSELPLVLTNRKVQERFIKNLIRIAKKWHSYNDKTEWQKIEGMLFSIFATIDDFFLQRTRIRPDRQSVRRRH
jgi:hypothetical protein